MSKNLSPSFTFSTGAPLGCVLSPLLYYKGVDSGLKDKAGEDILTPYNQQDPSGKSGQFVVHHLGPDIVLSRQHGSEVGPAASLPCQMPKGLQTALQGAKDLLPLHH